MTSGLLSRDAPRAWPIAAWRATVVVSLGLLVGGFLSPAPVNNLLFCLLGVVLLVITLLRQTPIGGPLVYSRGPLWLLFVAAGLFLAADVVASFGVGSGDPFPTLVDLLRVPAFVLFIALTAWVTRLRGRAPNALVTFDSLVFVATLLLPVWTLYLGPVVGDPASTSADIAAAITYSAITVVGLGVGARYVIGGGRWNVTSVLNGVGFGATLLLQFAILAMQAAGHWTELAFDTRAMIGFACWSVAVSWPAADMAQAPPRDRDLERMRDGSKVILLPAVLSMPLAIIAVQYARGAEVDFVAAAVCFGALILASLGRGTAHARADSEWRPTVLLVVITISTTFIVGTLAGFAQRAHHQRTALSTLESVVPPLQRADHLASSPPAASAAALADAWEQSVARAQQLLQEAEAEGADQQVARAGAALDGYAGIGRDYWQRVNADPARPAPSGAALETAHEQAVAALLGALTTQRTNEREWTTATRVATVIGFALLLVVASLLLIRYYKINRKFELEQMALIDGLTGLPSRLALEHRLRAPQLGHPDVRQALVVLDLDDFKVVNDSLGHPVGNELLVKVADRLSDLAQPGQFLARVDGDAFGLLLEQQRISEASVATAERIAAAFDEPIELAGHAHRVSASVGIVIDDDPDVDRAGFDGPTADRATVLLRNAEVAMYEAKRAPGFTVEVFAPAMHEAVRNQIELTNELREAIEAEQLHLVYQPIVDLTSGVVLGYEALARWNHPTRGPLSPAEFIPLAERTGLIVELGGWALREACRQMVEWTTQWDDSRYVSVNVAGPQLQCGALPEQVRTALASSGLNPAQLLLEVTESSLIDDVEASERLMDGVRQLGVRFALDDFGTGYSSLSYLRRFPVQVLKIDKSFVDDVADDASGGALVSSIIDMAVSLRMRVVAEGIEHESQAEALRSMGCELGQGYRYSRPLPAAEVPEFATDAASGPGTLQRPALRIIRQRHVS